MMRIFFLFGLLVLLTPRAMAFDVGSLELPETCEALEGVEPFGRYTSDVLQRIDDGLQRASEAPVTNDFSLYRDRWLTESTSTVLELIDDSLIDRQLLSGTACQHFDELLLQCKLEQIRAGMRAAYGEESIAALVQLQSLHRFTQNRLQALRNGATDPQFQDTTLASRRAFDDEDIAFDDEPVCPFSSDYLPPAPTGYGCHARVLADRLAVVGSRDAPGIEPIAEEENTLRILTQQLSVLASQRGDVFLQPQQEAEGCFPLIGTCSDDSRIACSTNEDCASAGVGTCTEALSGDAGLITRASPFRLRPHELPLVSAFLRLQDRQALARGVQAPEEEDEQPQFTPFNSALTSASWSRLQARMEVLPFIRSTDTASEMERILSPLYEASVSLSSLTAKREESLRQFVIDYAAYLRRTCLYGPCTQKLERIMATAFADACFPFTSETTTSFAQPDDLWKACAEQVCDPLEDNPPIFCSLL